MDPPLCAVCGVKHWGRDHVWNGKAPAGARPSDTLRHSAPDPRDKLITQLRAEVESLKAENSALRAASKPGEPSVAKTPKKAASGQKTTPSVRSGRKAKSVTTDEDRKAANRARVAAWRAGKKG
jgi:hypothetical protein